MASDSSNRNDALDDLDSRLRRLAAFLSLTYGRGGEAFRGYSGEVQDNYMWACHELALDCSNSLRAVLESGKELSHE